MKTHKYLIKRTQMKKLPIIAIASIFLFSACNNASDKNENAVADSTVSNVIDENGIKETETRDTSTQTIPADSVKKEEDKAPESPADKILVGKHNITLQWIGWNIPGSAVIEKGDNDWYSIKARQESKTGYLIVDGKLKPGEISDGKILKLKFDGLIEYKEETINNNKPCSKRGEQEFISTQGRKYWRLQNMLNCDGITTDYVDIYF